MGRVAERVLATAYRRDDSKFVAVLESNRALCVAGVQRNQEGGKFCKTGMLRTDGCKRIVNSGAFGKFQREGACTDEFTP